MSPWILGVLFFRGFWCADVVGQTHFEVASGSYSCRVSSHGVIRCLDGPRGAFELSLTRQSGECVESAHGTEVPRGLLLLSTLGEAGYASSQALLIAPDGRRRWAVEVPGFNLGEPLIEGDAAYVTALGFVGRLDLETGSWRWRHDDLYRNFVRSEVFEKPVRRGSEIEFREQPRSDATGVVLLVDSETGGLRVQRP